MNLKIDNSLRMSNLPPDFGQLAREANERARIAQAKIGELVAFQAKLLSDTTHAVQAAANAELKTVLTDTQPGSINALLATSRAALMAGARQARAAKLHGYIVLGCSALCMVVAGFCAYASFALAESTDEVLKQAQARHVEQQVPIVAQRPKRR